MTPRDLDRECIERATPDPCPPIGAALELSVQP